MMHRNTLDFAQELDREDELAAFRNEFFIPKINGKESIYFTGNSLGLQPKSAKEALNQELEDWANLGVEGHFHAKNPWFSYHELFSNSTAQLVGALPSEVVLMNSLTTNLHLLMVSFYQPKGKRVKIICEKKAFPSDQYALESQVKFHGLDPNVVLVEVGPRAGSHIIEEEDIINAIKQNGDELALVMIGGVNYYTGQVFDMESIAKEAHSVGAKVGFDLAHGVGNIELNLHDWGVDFACWCTYKYLNSGPGSVSGVFIHERHANDSELPRFAGWWGYDKSSRFEMTSGFKAIPGAEGWQLSNAPVFNMAIHKVSLAIFDRAGMKALRTKSLRLTAFLEFILEDISAQFSASNFEIITPKAEKRRGCQVSILAHGHGKSLFDRLSQEGVIADWREPNVIRIAPVPLYNSYEDIYRFGVALTKALKQ